MIQLFEVGQLVDWADFDETAAIPNFAMRIARDKYGPGPFTVLSVQDAWPGAVHPQFITIARDGQPITGLFGGAQILIGAYFKLVA